MTQKKSPLSKSEPRGIDFIPKMKSNEKGVSPNIISLEDNNVKHPLEDVMTLLFHSLAQTIEGKTKKGEAKNA